ncbi:MAG: ABC transporter substrate-binding protein [Thermomicrobiales bacterium]|nr:ABC transporter substrate-binding protein [Thermomicrobiales bacterium]
MKLTRRSFAALAGATPLAFQARGFAQTPAASPAADDLFADINFTPGEYETPFGVIQLPENPQRIVTLDDGPLDAILALGVQPIGYTASSNGETAAAYLADKVSADATIVDGGWTELDIEQVIALEPDLIIDSRYRDEADVIKLSEIAPVMIAGSQDEESPEKLQWWEQEQLAIGHALGMLEEAKQVVLDLRARGAAIAEEAGDKAGQSVVVFRPQADFPVIMSHHWITGVVLTWSGFVGNDLTNETPSPHSGDTISLEMLNLMEADWLFAASRNEEMTAALEAYKENAAFQTITAVKNGQVALVAGDLWSGATGVLAGHAMMDDIEKIIINGDY